MKMTAISKFALPMSMIALLAACGGSDGGHDSKKNTTLENNTVEFTEDSSLNENITGLWIATSDVDYTEQYSDFDHSFVGTRRESFYIIEDESSFGDVLIGNCEAIANNPSWDSTNLQFTVNDITYTLSKVSNTRFEGSVEYVSDESYTRSGGGTITFNKVAPAPATVDDFIAAVVESQLSLGTLSYSLNGGATQTKTINCYADSKGTETYADTDSSESIEIEEIAISNVSNFEGIEATIAPSTDYEDYLDVNLNGQSISFASDFEPGHVNYHASGTDNVTITFDASMTDNSDDASSDTMTFTGEAHLNF